MYASNSHSYTHLILALGIVRKPTVWVLLLHQAIGIHDIGLPTTRFLLCLYRCPRAWLQIIISHKFGALDEFGWPIGELQCSEVPRCVQAHDTLCEWRHAIPMHKAFRSTEEVSEDRVKLCDLPTAWDEWHRAVVVEEFPVQGERNPPLKRSVKHPRGVVHLPAHLIEPESRSRPSHPWFQHNNMLKSEYFERM